jgi:hypothetical protein
MTERRTICCSQTPVVPVAVVVNGGPCGRQAVLEVLKEIRFHPNAHIIGILISSPAELGRIGGDVSFGQATRSRTNWKFEVEIVKVKIILVIGGKFDSDIFGAFGEEVFVKLPCVLVVSGHLFAPNEGIGRFGRCGVTHLEGLGIAVAAVFIIERHVHTSGSLKLRGNEILGRVGVPMELEAIVVCMVGVCGYS